eukprot:8122274-Alexandrium_andersonii.AAC.1
MLRMSVPWTSSTIWAPRTTSTSGSSSRTSSPWTRPGSSGRCSPMSSTRAASSLSRRALNRAWSS